jgi:predicted O-methyltransferase YrrM
VIGTELLESKAERAREHLREAGVADQVDLRVGDALQTLADLGDGVDMLLNDGYPRFALPVMQLVAPRLRPGAIALGANTGFLPGQHADYLAWVRDPRNGFRSWALPMWMSGELSVKS